MKTFEIRKKYQRFVALTGGSLVSVFICSFTTKALAKANFVMTDAVNIVFSEVVQNNKTVVNPRKSEHLQNESELNQFQPSGTEKRHQKQSVLQTRVKPMILAGCVWYQQCPGINTPIGCLVCR